MPVDAARLAALFGAECIGRFEPEPAPVAPHPDVPVVSPPSLAACSEVLAWAARDRQRVLFAGAGEHWFLAPTDAPADFILSTRHLTRIVEYEPEEMVLVTETGAKLTSLAALVAPHAQRLGPDPWRGRAATIGGAIAGGRFGIDRLRRGTWRDALLGARIVHVDGTTSKTGGRVVKNVAGYDLGKLHVGARGALALLAEVNLRLVPRPEAAAIVVAAGTRAHAVEALLEIHRSALAPVALLLVAGEVLPALPIRPGSAACLVRFEGRAAAVRWQADETLRRVGGAEWDGEEARSAWRALQVHAEPRPGTTLLRIATLPTDVGLGLESLAAAAVGWRSFVGQFGVGTSDAHLDRCSEDAAGQLAHDLARRGARLEVLHPPGLHVTSDADPIRAELAARTRRAFVDAAAPSGALQERER